MRSHTTTTKRKASQLAQTTVQHTQTKTDLGNGVRNETTTLESTTRSMQLPEPSKPPNVCDHIKTLIHLCDFNSKETPSLLAVLKIHGQSIAFVMLAALAALSFSHHEQDIEACLQGGPLLTQWLRQYDDFSTDHKLGATHEYVFLALCLGNQKVLPASLYNLVPETRLVPTWTGKDTKSAHRLQQKLGNHNIDKMMRDARTWSNLTLDMVQLWMEDIYKEVRACRQISNAVMGETALKSIHSALEKLTIHGIMKSMCAEISKCLQHRNAARISRWCGNYIYAVTHAIYVLAAYTHGFKKDVGHKILYSDVHTLMSDMASIYNTHTTSKEQWYRHAEYAIEITIALHLMSVDENNEKDDNYPVPQCCTHTRRYIESYPTQGTLNELVLERQENDHKRATQTNYIYDEIHTRMVIMHALAVFARIESNAFEIVTTTRTFRTVTDSQRHILQAQDFKMVMNYVLSRDEDAHLSAKEIAMAIPRTHLSARSQTAYITHVLAYLTDHLGLLSRGRSSASAIAPNTYSIRK